MGFRSNEFVVCLRFRVFVRKTKPAVSLLLLLLPPPSCHFTLRRGGKCDMLCVTFGVESCGRDVAPCCDFTLGLVEKDCAGLG